MITPEAAYIRLCLIFPETLDVNPVDPARFVSPRHAKALKALQVMHAEGRGGYAELDAVMGKGYTSSLPDLTDFAASTSVIVRQIEDQHARVSLATVLQELQSTVADPTQSTAEKIAEAVGRLLELQGEESQLATWREVLSAGVTRIETVHASGGMIGIPTGWEQLDRVIGGWEADKLYFVAARPGAGKTSFGLQAAIHAAKAGANCYVSSQEMGAVQVALRTLSQEARISSERMRTGAMLDSDWPKLAGAAGRLVSLPGWFDTRTGVSFDQLRASILRVHAKQPVGFVLVDYVQMMRGSGESKVYELENVAYGLKALAKEIKAPVLALSQLNREADPEQEGSAKPKAPGISKMRGSGGLEQAADVILILWQPRPKDNPQAVEVRIAKHRDGRTGKFETTFQREFTRFEEVPT